MIDINWEAFILLKLEGSYLKLMEAEAEWGQRSIREQRREAMHRAEELLANYRQQIGAS